MFFKHFITKNKYFVIGPPCEGHGEALFTTGAFLIALSSGELRQIAGPEFKLLDSRIRETRLPRLTGGKVLMLHLNEHFLLAVQATSCNVFLRQEKFVQNTSRNVKFSQRAVAANMCEVAGELCLYVFLSSGHLELFALPSLHPVASLPVRLPSAMGPEAVNLCSDGSCCIRSGSTSSVWLTSALETCDAVALERSVRSATLAQLIQGLQNTVTWAIFQVWGLRARGILENDILRSWVATAQRKKHQKQKLQDSRQLNSTL